MHSPQLESLIDKRDLTTSFTVAAQVFVSDVWSRLSAWAVHQLCAWRFYWPASHSMGSGFSNTYCTWFGFESGSWETGLKVESLGCVGWKACFPCVLFCRPRLQKVCSQREGIQRRALWGSSWSGCLQLIGRMNEWVIILWNWWTRMSVNMFWD